MEDCHNTVSSGHNWNATLVSLSSFGCLHTITQSDSSMDGGRAHQVPLPPQMRNYEWRMVAEGGRGMFLQE